MTTAAADYIFWRFKLDTEILYAMAAHQAA